MHGTNPVPKLPKKIPMQADPNAAPPTLDDETLAFAARLFQYARMGHAEELAELFGQGLPANLRNDKGDSLLMLAAYNGQAATARVILEAGVIPNSPTTAARPRSPAPRSRAMRTSSGCCWSTARRSMEPVTAPARR